MLVLHDWLKDYCGDGIPDVKSIEDLLTFHAFEIDEIKTVAGHEVIDVKVLPDRASDCLSHRGIAREIATLTEKPLVHDPLMNTPVLTPETVKMKVSIENPSNCRRFALALMTGITVKESPEWLKSRLEALGQRSINNVVDATNYVMLALGQPLHAYDAKKFAPSQNGEWRFGVRMARDGEEVTTLSGDTLTLTHGVQLIVNEEGDVPVGIAGIKGGKSTEIDITTTDIILEAANFNPLITRKAAQQLKLQTDASKRFENNISPELVAHALVEVVSLIKDIASGTCEGYVDVYPAPEKNSPVSVTLAHINALLGIQITGNVVERIFSRLGFSYTQNDDAWQVTPSPWRRDICIAEDVIAEVGRVYGYEHVESVLPLPVVLPEYSARQYYSEKIRSFLTAQGFSEVITSSFRKKDSIELQNSLASDKGYLRSTLTQNLIEVLDRNMPNADLLGVRDIRVFEIGTVFQRSADPIDVVEHMSLALGVRTKQQGYVPKDDAILAEIVKMLEVEIGTTIQAQIQKGVFECNFTELVSTLPPPTTYEAFVPTHTTTFASYSQYPFASRDIALWAPESTTSLSIEGVLREAAGALLARITLFDEFKKEGRVSYAFRLVFQSMERTLTDDEIGKIMEAVTKEVQEKGFEVR